MTIEHRVLYDIHDLRGLRLECPKCHAAIDFALESKFNLEVPSQCPSCRIVWKDTMRPATSGIIEDVVKALRRLHEVESMAPAPYKLRFHFDDVAPSSPAR